MKNLLIILMASLLMTACHYENGTQLKTVSTKVNANEWNYTQEGAEDQFNNNYFYAVVPMPEITEKVFDYGEVKAYAVFDRMDYQNARKHLLPYVLHKEEALGDGVWNYYTETYDFTYGIGWAEFNFRASDFAYEDNVNINPPTMEFDIVITYPQNR